MDSLDSLREQLARARPAAWGEFPDIALYMDQLISYMQRQLSALGQEEKLTPSMVNNYIKEGLLPRAESKRYSRTHLAHLTAICVLKQVLLVKEVDLLLGAGGKDDAPGQYAFFRAELDEALKHTAQFLEGDCSDEASLGRMALSLALRSYADRLACRQILAELARRRPPSGKKGKK